MERRGNGLHLLVVHRALNGLDLLDLRARGVPCTRREQLPVGRAGLRVDLGLHRVLHGRDLAHDLGLGRGRVDLRGQVVCCPDRVRRRGLRVRRDLDSAGAASGTRRAKKAR